MKPFGGEDIQTSSAVIRQLWNELAAGKNVDRVRARSVLESPDAFPIADSNDDESERSTKLDPTEIAKRTTVRIQAEPDERGWSGVVISSSGIVATCGHHGRLPGKQVTVHFSDGRQAAGEILGTNHVTDIGLVQITDPGDWPLAELGLSQKMSPGDRCFIAGYPSSHKGVEPIIWEGKVIEPDDYVWSSLLWTAATYETRGGQSGGGVFDENGNLVAVHKGSSPQVKMHRRAEFFRLQWPELTSGEPVDALQADDEN